MRAAPRQPLDRQFVRAVRESGQTLVTLAALANFASYTQLSTVLSARLVRASALMQTRLAAIATVIGYSGPIFKEASHD